MAPLEEKTVQAQMMVQSGGVSLGSYGGGFAYYMTSLRKQQKLGPLEIVTGASAGSINAFLTAISLCKQEASVPSPTQSIFYRTWVPVGMQKSEGQEGLATVSAATASSLFSQAPIDRAAQKVRDYFDDVPWIADPCEIVFGIVSTFHAPRSLDLRVGGQGTSPRGTRQSAKFIMRLKKEAGGVPLLSNAVDLIPREQQGVRDLYPMLGHAEPGATVDFPLFVKLLKASAAFPFAFPPEPLPVSEYDHRSQSFRPLCESGRLSEGDECDADMPKFVDGAVYENVPLMFANRLDQWFEPLANGARRRAIVLDYDSELFTRKVEAHATQSSNLLPSLFGLATQVIGSSFWSDYFRAFEEHPVDRLSCTQEPGVACDNALDFAVRALPAASNHFLNFLGFFERDFREFDFYLGMLDARRMLQSKEQVTGQGPDWQVFECFKQWEDASAGFIKWPKRGSVPHCEELAGAGCWDPVKNVWQKAEQAETDADDGTCTRREAEGPYANIVRLLAAAQRFRQILSSETTGNPLEDNDRWFKVIRHHGVVLHDLTDEVSEVDAARREIRDILNGQLQAMAAKQGGGSRLAKLGNRSLSRVGLSVAANLIEYREPRWELHVGGSLLRGAEVGLGLRPSAAWFRSELTASFLDIHIFDSMRRTQVSPRLRLVFPLGSYFGAIKPWFQLEPLLGLAWDIALRQRADERPEWYGFTAELGSHLVLLQRLYITLGGLYRWREEHVVAPWPDRRLAMFSAAGWRFIW